MGRVLLFGIAFLHILFFSFLFLWDRLSVYPFRRGIFILFVPLVLVVVLGSSSLCSELYLASGTKHSANLISKASA